MFDFAISQTERRRPGKRVFASWILSCLVHLLTLLLLIQFPQLLQGGMYHRYRAFPLISNILGPKSEDDTESWRTVAVLKDPSHMSAPSAATLKKYMYDWDKKESGPPPIRLSWGDVEISRPDLPPVPRIRQDSESPDISLLPNELAATGPSSAANAGETASEGFAAQSGEEAKKKEPAYISSQKPAPETELAENTAPKKIPDSIGRSTEIPPAEKDDIRVFEDEQKAIRSPDSGFFDTKGFPLGEYTNIIVERIKGKWFIPSNLRNSRGNTTVIFYIDRDGQFMDARIVMSSGSNSLDLAALNAVIESNPFPPLPEDFPGDHVGAKFIFSYNEPR
jgi:TonB family protein